MCDQDTIQFTFYKKEMDSLYSPEKYLYKGMYIDRYNEFRAQAGQKYTLQVRVPDGRTVTGTTSVPNYPTINRPGTNEILKKQTIKETTINWVDDENTIAYLVEFYVTIIEDEYSYFNYNMHNILDDYLVYHSPATLKEIDLSFLYTSVIQLSDTATIKILALDHKLYDYATKSSMASLTGTDLNLLEGGVGVFGSISVDSVNVILE